MNTKLGCGAARGARAREFARGGCGIWVPWTVLFLALATPGLTRGEEAAAEAVAPAPVPSAPIPSGQLTLGSSEEDARKLLGDPAKTNRFGGEVEYYYGQSQLKFERGALVQWYSAAQPLPVFIADRKADAPPIVVGAKTNVVLEAMGSPTGLIVTDLPRKQEIWHYGASSLVIYQGHVETWHDAWNLAVSPKTNHLGDKPFVLEAVSVEPTKAVTVKSPSTNAVITIYPRVRPRVAQPVRQPPVENPPAEPQVDPAPVPATNNVPNRFNNRYRRRY
jgi:hypothetical protein